MKKIVMMLAVGSLFAVGCSDTKIDEASVPTAVVTAYQDKYPGAVTKKWVTEKEDGQLVYEVRFELNDDTREAEFFSDGSFRAEE